MVRAVASVVVGAACAALIACAPGVPAASWTCDFDASEVRPLADPDAAAGEGGALSPSECEATCGPPADSCTRTVLDGGRAGAVCPVCTF